MKRLNLLLKKSLFVLVLVAFASCNNDDNDIYPELPYSEQLNVSYGPNELHKMDVYLPKNRTLETKVVVAVHGGGFIGGEKEDLDIPVEKLVENGYAVININYRLVDTTGVFQEPLIHQPSKITINEQLQDIGLAINFALGQSNSWVVSPHHWAMFGHSAGATLALLYTHGDHNSNEQIKAVGNLAGALNFGFQDESEFDLLDPRLVEILYRAIGAEPENGSQLAYMAKSPFWVAFNNENPEPTINLLPENDDTGSGTSVSEDQFIAYRDLLNAKQVPNQYIVVLGADHGFSQPGKWQEAAQHLADFFESHAQ